MSSVADAIAPARFRPAAPEPLPFDPGPFRFLIEVGKNAIGAFGPGAFEQRFVHSKGWFPEAILVNEPDAIKHILVDNWSNYVKNAQMKKLVGPALGDGLFLAEGARWRFQRRMAAPTFQMRHVTGTAPEMAAAAGDMLARWDALNDPEIDAASEMMRVTYDVISRTMFSNDVGMPYDRMQKALTTYLDTLGRTGLMTFLLPGWAPTPNRLRGIPALRTMKREIGALVRRRRDLIEARPDAAPNDLLTLLITAKDSEGGAVFSDAEVFDNTMTFIFAGHETTANALTWSFYLLSQSPEWDEKVAREAHEVLGDRAPSAGDVSRLAVARMVVEEAMRLYPPAPFISRHAVAGDAFCEQAIGPGAAVTISPWVLHRHKLLWKDPEYFDPSRFAPGAREHIHRFAYLPFGAGPRICIGMAFALQEAAIVLASVARRYRLSLQPGFPVEAQARLTLRPKHGLKMRLERR